MFSRTSIVGHALRLPCNWQPICCPTIKQHAEASVSEFQFGGDFVWWPSPELNAKSNLQQFIEKHRLGSYDEQSDTRRRAQE